jgi:hypothetical protein
VIKKVRKKEGKKEGKRTNKQANKQNYKQAILVTFHLKCYVIYNPLKLAVPWLRRLVAGLSSRRPGFDKKKIPG